MRLLEDPAPQMLRHYTDDAGRRGIELTGVITPGSDAVPNHSAPRPVLPHYGQPGGGIQISTTELIDAKGLMWIAIEP